MAVAARISDRISTQLKRYQGILEQAHQRDVSESNTVVIVADMLSDVLGYDKYQHITTEHAIRGTYVNLAVVMDGDIRFLIEVKAIGLDLKDAHVKQAVDYGANKGVEWVILTNGAIWRIYKIIFAQPSDKTLVYEMDVLATSPKDHGIIECLGNLSREGFSKGSMAELAQRKLVTSKFAIATVLLGDTMLEALRRELRRLSPGVRIEFDFLRDLLEKDVVKRDLVEGDEAAAARVAITRLQRALAREREKRKNAVLREVDDLQTTAEMPTEEVLPVDTEADSTERET